MLKWFRNDALDPNSLVPPEDLRKLTKCLSTCNFEKPIELKLSSKPLAQIINILNHQITARQEASIASTLELNQIVGFMTNMTCIRDMLNHMKVQTDYLTSMAAQAEQMGASSSEIASAASSAAAFVEASVRTANEGTNRIKEALKVVEDSFIEFEAVVNQVQEVLSSMDEINQIIEVISGVADQTNLLALNAAIEAARAGEHGRGFAVVADEVRKLAEHTKESVGTIKGKISHLSTNSHQAAESIVSLTNRMKNGRATMQGAGSAVEEISQQIQSIATDIGQIAAGSEEQSAAVQEFSSGITTVAQASEITHKLAQETGEGIYHISQELGRIRLNHLSQQTVFSTIQALELSKTDHLLWTWRIYNMLLGYETVDPQSVGTHHDCRLGRWVDSPDADPLRSHPLFQKLEKPHSLVHECAREAALAYQAKDLAKAEQLLMTMSQASKEVVEILNGLQNL